MLRSLVGSEMCIRDSFGEVCAIVWSYVPYGVGLALLIHLLYLQRTWSFLLLTLASLVVVSNEACIKRILAQDRPDGSCIDTKGMPSSHAEISLAWWAFCMYQVLFKPQYAVPSTTSSEKRYFSVVWTCLLYTSDAADEEDSVDLGGRRIIKKKKNQVKKKRKK
eukprot:TRINITY_DN47419_c0_g1_i1.p1 TRINITY_DN47419_c0_g1~~TRINITY_DN47419_c0_g1_i1.p1  ORF type:complete len:192 (-),score=57.99 TRINITY_DN47419_c0_g1_i1:19-510(-)